MMRLPLILSFLCFASLLWSQEPSLQFDCAPDSVRLGTPFKCSCTLSLPQGATLKSLTLPLDSLKTLSGLTPSSDTLPTDYEILDYGNWRQAKNNEFLPADLGWKANPQNGFDIYYNSINLIIWQPGIFQVPAIIAEVNWNNADYEVLSNEQYLKVDLPNQVANVDSSGLAPIKSIILTERNWNWLYWTIGLGILALLLIYYLWKYFFKSKQEEIVEKKEIIPAHVIALRALSRIEKEEVWIKGEFKKYYDELTYVLREYLENRYEVPALESTTEEILRDLKKTKLPEKYQEKMRRLLPMSDMVKFAKMMPHEEEHKDWLLWVRGLVQQTKQEIINEEEKKTTGE